MEIQNYLPVVGNPDATSGKKILAPNEKIVAWSVALLILGAAFWFLTWVVPILLTLVKGLVSLTLYTLVLALLIGIPVGIGIYAWMSWDRWTLKYQLYVKKMWRAIVKSDPISVMEIQWTKWQKKRSGLNTTIVTMTAAKDELLMAMDEKEAQAKENFKAAKKATELSETKKDSEYIDFRLKEYKKYYAKKYEVRRATKSSIIANRLMQSNQNFVPRLKAIQTAIDYCTELYNHWGDDLELLKQDIDMKKQDLKLYSSTSNAFDSARSILNDNPDERALWEMSTEVYAETLSNYVANISRFTEQAKDWVYNKDIQSASWEDEGNKLLSMYDTETFAKLTDFRSLVNKDENVGFAQKSNEYQKILADPMPQGDKTSTFKDLI